MVLDVRVMKKHVVISGATRGLGRAMAVYFAQEGWKVSGCGRNEKDVAALQKELGKEHRMECVDVSDNAQVARWARMLEEEGRQAPDLLLNNAAVMSRLAPVWELTAKEVDAALQVNIAGTIHMIRHFVPRMIARKSGVVVNFSSGWGRSTSPEVAVYCTTKWAIEGLTSALAQELPRGLAAVALNPGVIATDMLRSCWGDAAEVYPGPEEWIRTAGPFLAELSAKDNGRALTVPGARGD